MESAEIEAHDAPHTGRRWLDAALAVAAVPTSLCSLILAIENGSAMQHLVAANSWPFVKVGVTDQTPFGGAALELVLQNKGVGPAKVETLEVFFRDEPVAGPHALMRAMLGPDADRAPYFASRIVGGVLASKESLSFVAIDNRSVDPAVLKTLVERAPFIRLRTCYCSAFDECWVLDRAKAKAPRRMNVCPTPAVPFDD
jgi:hypothetical protein